MDQQGAYSKILGMVTEGMERVHNTYMAEMDKAEPDKMIELCAEYAKITTNFATIVSAVGLLKPYTPWVNGCAS